MLFVDTFGSVYVIFLLFFYPLEMLLLAFYEVLEKTPQLF